jgi:hypothetical protein
MSANLIKIIADNTDPAFDIWQQRGLVGLSIYIFLRDVTPFITNKFFPDVMKNKRHELDAMLKREQDELDARIEERKWRHEFDEKLLTILADNTAALKQLSERVEQGNRSVSALTQLITNSLLKMDTTIKSKERMKGKSK